MIGSRTYMDGGISLYEVSTYSYQVFIYHYNNVPSILKISYQVGYICIIMYQVRGVLPSFSIKPAGIGTFCR